MSLDALALETAVFIQLQPTVLRVLYVSTPPAIDSLAIPPYLVAMHTDSNEALRQFKDFGEMEFLVRNSGAVMRRRMSDHYGIVIPAELIVIPVGESAGLDLIETPTLRTLYENAETHGLEMRYGKTAPEWKAVHTSEPTNGPSRTTALEHSRL